MTFIAPTRARSPGQRSEPIWGSAGGKLPSCPPAADFAEVLTVALEEALAALGHRSPEQYLHLAAARRRETAQAERRVHRVSRHEGHAKRMRLDHAIVQQLSFHLAFEILGVARRYSAFVANLGGRQDRIPSGSAISASPHTPEGRSRSPSC